MRLSHYFLKPRKDAPSDATLISHKLMIKSSMIKQTTSGIYAWLPLGLKVLKKIEDIIRKFHNLYGCQELLMPTIQSSSIWKKSERYNDYGPEMLKFRDRNKKELLYGPTNEELITEIFKEYINSYKDLPKNLYQIQWKFRDEIRPRYGVMRCREFLMKDNYSFDISKNDAEKSYDNMFKCYLEIFNEIGINVIPVKADPGAMGGDLSHEFHLISKSGDTDIYYDKSIGNINSLNTKNSFKLLRNLYSVTKDEYKKKQDLDASKLIKTKGIEIGHIFYFGTKYSEAMGAFVSGPDGGRVTMEMGSYGIGVSRLVGAIIEANHDDDGIIWPDSVAPFRVGVVNLKPEDHKCNVLGGEVYEKLRTNGIDTLYEDREGRAGVKFANMDLIGLPWQLIIGPRGAAGGRVELKSRKTGQRDELSMEDALKRVIA